MRGWFTQAPRSKQFSSLTTALFGLHLALACTAALALIKLVGTESLPWRALIAPWVLFFVLAVPSAFRKRYRDLAIGEFCGLLALSCLDDCCGRQLGIRRSQRR